MWCVSEVGLEPIAHANALSVDLMVGQSGVLGARIRARR
jgi:hypothetical protein